MARAKRAEHIGHWYLWQATQDGTLEELQRRWYGRSMAKHTDRRAEILLFWRRHGLAATKEAFNLDRATLYRWQQRAAVGKLLPGSTAPHTRRTRAVSPLLVTQLIWWRRRYPRLGKDKLRPLLREFCLLHHLPLPSVSTLGRVLTDLKSTGQLPSGATIRLNAKTGRLQVKQYRPRRKLRRPATLVPQLPGDLVQLDTIVRHIDGRKRYTVTAIDLVSRFAFAMSFTSHGSTAASRFLTALAIVTPFPIVAIQTDNGSEFAGYFTQAAAQRALTHYYNYPHSPKSNAYVERFNRTLSEEFLTYHRTELASDVGTCNRLLSDWLVWYNTERPHYALQQRPPVAVLSKQSQMYWTHTST